MVLLAVESLTWPQILLVTGLGFGIVVALLFCLVFILKGLGWTMQKITAPKTPKAPKEEKPAQNTQSTPNIQNTPSAPEPKPAPSEPEKAAIAMAIASADEQDTAAVAYALYLASLDVKHDAPTSMIAVQQRETAWNTKSIGMNNVGF